MRQLSSHLRGAFDLRFGAREDDRRDHELYGCMAWQLESVVKLCAEGRSSFFMVLAFATAVVRVCGDVMFCSMVKRLPLT